MQTAFSLLLSLFLRHIHTVPVKFFTFSAVRSLLGFGSDARLPCAPQIQFFFDPCVCINASHSGTAEYVYC